MSTLSIGDPAPDFHLPGVDGQDHALADYADRSALVVIFSCNHCPYVRAWEDRMIQLQNDFAQHGVQLIAINANNAASHPTDSFAHMQKHAAEKRFPFPYLHDEAQSVARAYGGQRTPEIFAFDSHRRLCYHGAIDDNYDDPGAVKADYLRQALNAMLAGKSAPISDTPAVGCSIKWKP